MDRRLLNSLSCFLGFRAAPVDTATGTTKSGMGDYLPNDRDGVRHAVDAAQTRASLKADPNGLYSPACRFGAGYQAVNVEAGAKSQLRCQPGLPRGIDPFSRKQRPAFAGDIHILYNGEPHLYLHSTGTNAGRVQSQPFPSACLHLALPD